MAELCKERLTRDDDTHFHVFLNSVDDISAIISGANLTPDNTKVVCSKSETSRQKNEEKLPKGFSIGNAGDDPKLFNFYTSTCFEGQDIFDKNGMIYIVEGAEYHSNYAEQTSYYDPETKTFHFFPAYYVSQGSFGQFEEVFEITEEGAIKRKASFRLGQDELNTSIKRVRVWKNFGKPSGRRVAQQKNNFYAAFSKDAVRK